MLYKKLSIYNPVLCQIKCVIRMSTEAEYDNSNWDPFSIIVEH